MGVVLSVLMIAVLVFALIDILTRTDDQIRGLPKFGWVILVILVPLVGSIVWFAIGHDWSAQPRNHGRYAEPLRPTTPYPSLADPHTTPGDRRISATEKELADLEREIEYWNAQARLKQAKEAAGEDEAPQPR